MEPHSTTRASGARWPSENLRDNFWFVMDPSECSISAKCDLLDESHFLWGSDYPHIDSHLNAPDEVKAVLQSVEPDRRDRILGGNAQALFGF
ncbi:MAG: amidohydrolase family protein [Gammaproteobacteria bacterium]|nr:amidohydrolase family protein [Gammaproteobacteria bacterium]MYK81179.1 amidohydrolase family protein [Gammaproteobacteria bacterium]